MSHVDEGLLHAYLDGALAEGDAERARVEAHLASCADCRVRMADARRVKEHAHAALGRLAPADVTTPAWDKIVTEHAARAQPAAGSVVTRSRRSWVPLAWAASLVMALGAGWMANQMRLYETDPSDSALRSTETFRKESNATAPAEPPAGSVDAISRQGNERAMRARADALSDAASNRPNAPAALEERASIQAKSASAGAAAPSQALGRTELERRELAPLSRQAVLADVVAGDLEKSKPASVVLKSISAQDSLRSYSDRRQVAEGLAADGQQLWRDYAFATMNSTWQNVTPADAAARLGSAPAALDGVLTDSVQIAVVENRVLVRTIHHLPDSTPVELVQSRTAIALEGRIAGAQLQVQGGQVQQGQQGQQAQAGRGGGGRGGARQEEQVRSSLAGLDAANVRTIAGVRVVPVPRVGITLLVITSAPAERVNQIVSAIR